MDSSNLSTELAQVDLDKQVTELSLQVKSSPEITALSKRVDIRNVQSIMSFGQETSQEISKFADQVLSTINNAQVEDSSKLLNQLVFIMKKFDAKDFAEEPPKSFLGKIFGKAADSIAKLLSKYETIDHEIGKIYVEIKKYEAEIGKTNSNLDGLFENNLKYYQALETYIEAGHLAKQRFESSYIPALEEKVAALGAQIDMLELQNAKDAVEMLDQRINDLEMAKMVALQALPQIKMIQRGNQNLLRKINSAFVVTIPVFKSGLIQAIAIKRQKLQADSLKALDDATNRMLINNAQNIANQSTEIARLVQGSSIKIETLEQTYQTIMRGIEETMQIQDENKRNREDSRQRLSRLQQEFEAYSKSKASVNQG